VAAARAERAWLNGRPEALPELLAEPFDLATRLGHRWAIGELGYWLWRAGELADPPAAAARPYALQVAGDWRTAAEAWRELGCPYELALALGDSDAEADLLAAFDRLERLGARPAADAVARRLLPVDQRAVAHDPLEQRGRLAVEGRIGILAEGARPRTVRRRVEQAELPDGGAADGLLHDDQQVLDREVLHPAVQASPRRRRISPCRSVTRRAAALTRRAWSSRSIRSRTASRTTSCIERPSRSAFWRSGAASSSVSLSVIATPARYRGDTARVRGAGLPA
jgi:hypothetical protein